MKQVFIYMGCPGQGSERVHQFLGNHQDFLLEHDALCPMAGRADVRRSGSCIDDYPVGGAAVPTLAPSAVRARRTCRRPDCLPAYIA